MRPRRAWTLVAIVAIVFVLAAPVSVGSTRTGHTAPTGPAAVPRPPTPVPAATARIADIERTLHADGVPARDIHLPDLSAIDPGHTGPVAPTYTSAPAPMGVADLGLENLSGTIVPTVLNTAQVEGQASFTSAESVYLDGDGPNMFGVQMNAVANGVTLFGRPIYQFWAQDYFSYTPDNGTLTFGNNLWNFSDPSTPFPANTLYSHGPNGTVISPIYYFATGPTFTVHYPFSVTFVLASAIVHLRPAIYFNYTITSGAGSFSGSFDRVIFNSSKFVPVFPARLPEFQANGTANGPVGLPNDFELVLVGNGGGDTTTFVGVNAQFSLLTWNSTSDAYQAIPSAYDAGSDTGETSNGVGVYYNETGGGVPIPVASLELGPSYVHGLWGWAYPAGFRTLSSNVGPANAFLFVTPGTAYNATIAQWAPTLAFTGGPAAISFPNGGNYYFEWFLSDYRPFHRSLDPAANSTAHATATMARSNALGIYTPLMAWGDSELPYITSSGTGTAASPYVIEANQYHAIDPVFGAINDWLFPVFPGILLVNTAAWVRATPSSLSIAYPATVASLFSSIGLPTTNHLQIGFWNVTNTTLEGATGISGWLSAELGFSPLGAVIFWSSTGNLIAANTFYDEGISLAFYGGSNNTVWGNSFLNSTAPATNQSQVENSGNNTTGIWESESGDLIYNNYFALPAPAYTPTLDPVSCEVTCTPATYVDRWNVSYAPASTVLAVLGMNLSGSIIGTTYQGGNYWSNYGTPSDPMGVLPYNDGGRITVGGDYLPLVLSPAYPVTVNELGLASGTVWGVAVAGIAYRTNETVVTVYAPNGTYGYTVLLPNGYTAPTSGNLTINGTGAEVTIVFTPLIAVTFTESGLLLGWAWNVTLLGEGPNATADTLNSSNDTIVFEVVPGNYLFGANSTGYNATPPNGTFVVGDANVLAAEIVFSLAPILTFSEVGLASGFPWTIEVTDGPTFLNFTSDTSSLVLTYFELPSTAYLWRASATNYTVHPGSGSGTPGVVASYTLYFAVVKGVLAWTVSIAGARVYIDGVALSNTSGAFSRSEAPGLYAIAVVAVGYEPYFNNVTVASGRTTTVLVTLTPIPTSPASTGPAGISYIGWGLIVGLAAVALLALAAAFLSSRRRGGSPPPVAPYAGVTPGPVPSARPPWMEDGPESAPTTPGPPPAK